MKNLKSATLFMWVFVFGALVCVLVLTMNNKVVAPVEESGDTELSSYEKLQREIEGKFEIIDNTDACAEALEEIYRDDEYIYYLPCVKSNNITIVMKDGNEYPIRIALENNLVTINELIARGLGVFKEEINDDMVTIEEIDDEEAIKYVEE